MSFVLHSLYVVCVSAVHFLTNKTRIFVSSISVFVYG